MKLISPTIKRLAHDRAGGRCERCGRSGHRRNWELHVHHLTYERRGKELLSDVVVLCLNCHAEEHPQHDFVDRKEQKMRATERRPKKGKNGKSRWGNLRKLWKIEKRRMRSIADRIDRRRA